MSEPDTSAELERRAAEQAAADERATRLLRRWGIVALVLLVVWIGIVLAGFR